MFQAWTALALYVLQRDKYSALINALEMDVGNQGRILIMHDVMEAGRPASSTQLYFRVTISIIIF